MELPGLQTDAADRNEVPKRWRTHGAGTDGWKSRMQHLSKQAVLPRRCRQRR